MVSVWWLIINKVSLSTINNNKNHPKLLWIDGLYDFDLSSTSQIRLFVVDSGPRGPPWSKLLDSWSHLRWIGMGTSEAGQWHLDLCSRGIVWVCCSRLAALSAGCWRQLSAGWFRIEPSCPVSVWARPSAVVVRDRSESVGSSIPRSHLALYGTPARNPTSGPRDYRFPMTSRQPAPSTSWSPSCCAPDLNRRCESSDIYWMMYLFTVERL
jgi:hypothetical protein